MWTWHGSMLLESLPVDHRSYLMFNVSSMNTYQQWMIHWYNSQNSNTKYIDEPMSTWNLDSRWITFDKLGKSLGGGGSDVCVLSERDQSGVNCQARGQSGNERVCSICLYFTAWDSCQLVLCCPSSIILLYAESLALYIQDTIINTFNSHPSVPTHV